MHQLSRIHAKILYANTPHNSLHGVYALCSFWHTLYIGYHIQCVQFLYQIVVNSTGA